MARTVEMRFEIPESWGEVDSFTSIESMLRSFGPQHVVEHLKGNVTEIEVDTIVVYEAA